MKSELKEQKGSQRMATLQRVAPSHICSLKMDNALRKVKKAEVAIYILYRFLYINEIGKRQSLYLLRADLYKIQSKTLMFEFEIISLYKIWFFSSTKSVNILFINYNK